MLRYATDQTTPTASRVGVPRFVLDRTEVSTRDFAPRPGCVRNPGCNIVACVYVCRRFDVHRACSLELKTPTERPPLKLLYPILIVLRPVQKGRIDFACYPLLVGTAAAMFSALPKEQMNESFDGRNVVLADAEIKQTLSTS